MNNLPKDLIIYYALMMDLPEILSLCLSSKKFNNIVCKNKTFWMNKLIHDYQVHNLPKGHTYKSYYKHINEKLKNVNKLLMDSSKEANLDLVRLALEKGADIYAQNKALRLASAYGHLQIVKYLVDKGANIHAY
ncbi:unnamed protein product, partial [marine sediment metagenome]